MVNTAPLNRTRKTKLQKKPLFHSLHHLPGKAACETPNKRARASWRQQVLVVPTPDSRAPRMQERKASTWERESKKPAKKKRGREKAKGRQKENGKKRGKIVAVCIKAGPQAAQELRAFTSAHSITSSCRRSTPTIISIPLIVLLLGPVAVTVGSLVVVVRRRTTAAEPR